MVYSITNQNLIIVHGGHATPGSQQHVEKRDGTKQATGGNLGHGVAGLGHQRHYPIFLGEDKQEYISLNGQTLVSVLSLDFKHTRRETVERV